MAKQSQSPLNPIDCHKKTTTVRAFPCGQAASFGGATMIVSFGACG
jgi:hypothetical protein